MNKPENKQIEADVRERLIFLIKQIIPSSHGRYDCLEKKYGISGRRWQNVYNRAQLPGIDMIVSILGDYPCFTDWLMTGVVFNKKQIEPPKDGFVQQEEFLVKVPQKNFTNFSDPGIQELVDKAAKYDQIMQIANKS